MLCLAPHEQFSIINFSSVQALSFCTRAEILTFNALALHADPGGHCWPGRERLSLITGLNESRISKATSGLEAKGLLRKVQATGWRVDYYLLPQNPLPLADPLPLAEPGGCPKRHRGVPKTAHRTDQRTDQTTERAATEPAVAQNPEPAPLSPVVLRTPEPPRPVKVSPPEEVPMDWITVGAAMRPDLDAAVIQTSAEKFLDDRRSKGIVLADWTPSWKNWIRNERGPKPVNPSTTAPAKPRYAIEQPSPYTGWTPGIQRSGKEETPEERDAAFAAHMKRLGATYDPIANVWIPKNAAPPRPVSAPEVVKPPVTAAPAPRADNPFRRDAMIVIQAINDGCSSEEVQALEAELRRRREAAEGVISGDG